MKNSFIRILPETKELKENSSIFISIAGNSSYICVYKNERPEKAVYYREGNKLPVSSNGAVKSGIESFKT